MLTFQVLNAHLDNTRKVIDSKTRTNFEFELFSMFIYIRFVRINFTAKYELSNSMRVSPIHIIFGFGFNGEFFVLFHNENYFIPNLSTDYN